jgi:very-short-patch-repair endonuclease
MEKFYIEVIRFKNYQIEKDIDNVINKITELVKKRLESPPWGI